MDEYRLELSLFVFPHADVFCHHHHHGTLRRGLEFRYSLSPITLEYDDTRDA